MFYIIRSDFEENIMGGTEMVVALSKVKNPENLNLVIMTGGSVNENGVALYSFGTDTRYQEDARCITLKELEDASKNSDMKFATVGFDAWISL